MVQICPWETGSEDAVGLLLMGTAGWQQKNEWKVCGTSPLSRSSYLEAEVSPQLV